MRKRAKGSIETLPSGALRVRVFAGWDPLTGKRFYLQEVVPAGPQASRQAEKVRLRLLNEVAQQRNPTTRATVGQLLDDYLAVVDVEPTTMRRYEQLIRVHIRPALGELPLAKLDGALLDRFYAQLRRCRERCGGRGHQRHRTPQAHECDERCQVVECRPLSASSVRAVHWIMSASLGYAGRLRLRDGQHQPTTRPRRGPRRSGLAAAGTARPLPEHDRAGPGPPRERQGRDRDRTRLHRPAPELRGRRRVHLPPRQVHPRLPGDRAAQEHHPSQGRTRPARGDPLLLLHHHPGRADRRADRRRGPTNAATRRT